MWTRMVRLQPGLTEVEPPKEEVTIDKPAEKFIEFKPPAEEVKIEPLKEEKVEEKVFDKLKSQDNEDSGTKQSRATPKRRTTKRRKSSVLGEAAKNQSGAKKVQDSKGTAGKES